MAVRCQPAVMTTPADHYTHGHHESVLRSHRWRTAANSCAYLLPHLRPGMEVLDVGCGPATITADLAATVAPGGRVLGIDRAADVVEAARSELGATPGLDLAAGDAYATGLPDAAFDVVHAHQVLQHLTDPVRALGEWRRVLRPGGLLAVRDSDYAAFAWAPRDPRLDRWMALYHEVTAANRAEADAGRFLGGWVRAAGFGEVRVGSSTWTYATAEERAWWGGLWADRVRRSAFADQALATGLAGPRELDAIAAAWREWADHPDGVIILVHGEVLARR